MLSPVLEKVHKQFRAVIESEGPAIACRLFKSYASKEATQVLAEQAYKLTPLLHTRAQSAKPAAIVDLADWSVYPPMQLMRQLILERPVAVKRLISLANPLLIPQFTRPVKQVINTSRGSMAFT